MNLLMSLRMLAVLAIVLLLITQIFLPMVSGGNLFPLFRRSERAKEAMKARARVADLRDQVEATTELKSLLEKETALERELEAVTSKPKAETPTAAPPQSIETTNEASK